MSEPVYTPTDKVVWKSVKYLKEPLTAAPEHATWKYEIELPEPLASWDVYDYWESKRIAAMEKHLKQGDVFFDVGTEQGWCNIIYGEIVGPENMVLIEPTQEFWPNIKAIWEKNFIVPPKACLPALLSDKCTPKYKGVVKGWPKAANGDLIDRNKYQYIHENTEKIPEITIDKYVQNSGVVPDAIGIDTEGSELLILKGGEKTLSKYKPKLFISVHPDLGERDYGVTREQTIAYIESLGYTGQHLATDHEEHWYFHAEGK
jgi:FkbM family methyltransferase